jgi:type IV fimbrial biogenesis protein FimT
MMAKGYLMLAGNNGAQRGFTLIELLLILMIVAIIAIMAVPVFSGFLARQQLASDVNEMISVLSFARSEAIKQRNDIAVTFSPPHTATSNQRPEPCRNNESVSEQNGETLYAYSGWCYWVERSGNVLRTGQAVNITTPENEFEIIFQPLGDAELEGCVSPCEITISPQRGRGRVEPVTLVVRITGSIRRKGSES